MSRKLGASVKKVLITAALPYANGVLHFGHFPSLILNLLNLVIVSVVYGLEKMYFTKRNNSQKIKYDKIELLKPKYNHLLHRDLSLRLGKEVIEVKTENVNFIEGFATLKVYYGNDYHIHTSEDGDRIILDHNEEINRILEERKREINLPRTAV